MARQRTTSGKIRLTEVAKLAGVSPITASRFFRNPEALSVSKRERVASAAKELGYVPNLAARALASQPRLLLLDEPAAGMNDAEKARLGELITQIRNSGITVLLIEHDIDLVSKVSDHIVVLNFGREIAEGTPAEIRRSPAVIEAYLGREDA